MEEVGDREQGEGGNEQEKKDRGRRQRPGRRRKQAVGRSQEMEDVLTLCGEGGKVIWKTIR